MINNDFISVSEAAQIMRISRIAVYKKIKKGEIDAKKIGRNYIVDKRSLGLMYQNITASQQKKIEQAVEEVVRQYSVALKKLGKE